MQFINIEQLSNTLVKRNKILEQLESLVNRKGYIKVEPDYFEPYERFIQMNKRIRKESMVKILNQDGSISILRPDITTNIIKQIIPKWSNGNTLKVFYIASTFRTPLMQPVVETRQFGVEYLGKAKTADIEIINLILSIFKMFDMDFILEIGNQSFLNSLFEDLALDSELEEQLKSIIDYKNQNELDKFINTNQIELSNAKLLSMILKLQGNLDDIINQLKSFNLKPKMRDALNELKILQETLNKENLLKLTTFDLSLISKFDYYDGITFKGYIKGVSYPILSGGRYDSLTKEFGNEVPATGFSLNLTELIKEVLK
ncbi:MAG: ATP phosphoribosyltransferase regulatory subunit [Acholeplasmataceae bacterium]|jgi:ATP phosphoribosyltransferase regulatory subunit|nr:ATP phosphoribosyltransferase regulatory subunit [Acholeplasmataceae bacterium]